MIKVVYCIQKPDDMDSKEFNRYWSNDIQLAAFFGGSFNAYRGVSSRAILPDENDRLLRDRPGMPAPYDGIIEYWWKSRKDFTDGVNTMGARAASERLLEEESHFIDFSRSRLMVTEERVLF